LSESSACLTSGVLPKVSGWNWYTHHPCRSLHHGEQCLVKMTDCLDAIGLIQLQLRTCLAQSRSVLGGCKHGNVQ
jgi:hypothetical protein